MAARRAAGTPTLADPISADLKQVLRTLKLGRLLDTLPERLTLARQQQLPTSCESGVVNAANQKLRVNTVANARSRVVVRASASGIGGKNNARTAGARNGGRGGTRARTVRR